MVPSYQSFLSPVLFYFSKNVEYQDLLEPICEHFHFTEEDKEQLIPSGRSKIQNRIIWAVTHLGKAGFVQNEGRGVWKISDLGRAWVNKFPNEEINNNVLCILSEPFQVFLSKGPYKTLDMKDLSREKLGEIRKSIKAYRIRSADSKTDEEQELEDLLEGSQESLEKLTPEEQIGIVYDSYRKTIISIIQDTFYHIPPTSFEKMVVDILTRCGYGHEDLNVTTKPTRDGGLDGIIYEDKLGIEKIGVQVKRYGAESSVSSPEIQKFVGALSSHGLRNGIFVTSSRFSKDALGYYKNHSNFSIALVDGEQLASLMFDNEIGIVTEKKMKIVELDKNFFGRYEPNSQ